VATDYASLVDLGMADQKFMRQMADIENKYGIGVDIRGREKGRAMLGGWFRDEFGKDAVLQIATEAGMALAKGFLQSIPFVGGAFR
jgi:hypothetical protein